MTKLNEKEIIDLFISKLRINKIIESEKDDVVIYPLNKVRKMPIINNSWVLVLKCDMLIQSTDVPPGMRPWQIARKSMVACISDLSAKGVKPPYVCLISIGIPIKYSKSKIIDLINGFQIASKEFEVKIVGGDTNKSSELVIDCNILGVSDRNTDIPKRNGAKPGHLIISSGEFGYPSSGLKILINDAKSNRKFRKDAILSVMEPKPQQRFGISLAKYFSSSIDSSDGLAISLYELARQSKVNLLIDNVPLANGIKGFAKNNDLDVNDLVFYGGEEYEIVATIPQFNLESVQSVARKSKLKFHIIGRVEKGNGKVIIKNEKRRCSLLDNYGYIHRFS
jgi:thiamine-monophosphate kinase